MDRRSSAIGGTQVRHIRQTGRQYELAPNTLVLELRYGLGGEPPRTFDEVGRTFNVTRKRIRQIENGSLNKLRALPESQHLRNDSVPDATV